MKIYLNVTFRDFGEQEKFFENEKACLEYIQKNIDIDMVESISIENEEGDVYVDGYTNICVYLIENKEVQKSLLNLASREDD